VSDTIEIAGSGSLRVTTAADVELAVQRVEEIIETDRFQYSVDDFWASLRGVGFSPTMIDKIWVANRCSQLNCQQIRSMPLKFVSKSPSAVEPKWVTDPDPVWYPNGFGDAVFAAMWSLYNWGDAFLYVTAWYADGYPSGWTVLEPSTMEVDVRDGRRVYKQSSRELDADRIVQVSRDPRGLRGTSALRSYAAQANALLVAADSGRTMIANGTPSAVIKSHKKVNETQAAAIQESWMRATSVRRGAPAVLGPDLDFTQLSFSPADLQLLESRTMDAKTIASAYGVPPFMVNLSIDGGLTYESAGSLGEHWWRFELRPMAGAFAQALGAQMLPAGSTVEFDARDTIAPSWAQLVEAFVKLVEKGIVDPADAAEALNLPPNTAQKVLPQLTADSAGSSPNQQADVVELRPSASN
jgi:HK97 family phage portal protein